jgi:hypothetical protein
LTPLKSQTDFTRPFSSFKGKSSKNILMANIPKLFKYRYLKQKKVGGCLDIIFGFSGVNETAETDFGDFRSDYLGEYDAMLIRDIHMGLIDEKNRGSKISCN